MTTEKTQQNNRSYLHTVGAASVSPLVQSAITGALIGGLILIVGFTQRWRDAGLIALYGGMGTTVILWLWHIKRWFALTAVIQQIETVTQTDINGDGRIGTPQETPKPEVVRVQITAAQDGRIAVKYVDLPISNDKLYQLAEGLHAGRPFSESEWTGAGNLFSQTEFRALRAEMLRRRLLKQNNPAEPRQGYSLTEEGQGMVDELVAQLPHSPTKQSPPCERESPETARTHAHARTVQE